jgi:nucleolar protein 12
MRFRSVAFQSPTAQPPAEDDAPNPKTQGKEGREHDRTRAAAWRQSQGENEAKEGKDEKKFLTPNQKKKIAFINQEFHSVADTVHAYAVFAYPPIIPSSEHASHKDVMNPYEAAEMAARQCDGSIFMDRLLRVDVVGKSSAADLSTDPKLTIFVGNLDFASREEDLRVFFEGVITKERGSPPELRSGEGEQAKAMKAQTWVTRVRIVRDRETQLGKGFAYVQFAVRPILKPTQPIS